MGPCRCTSSPSLSNFRLATTVYDITWDLFAFAGYSTASELGGGAIVVAFRGTDSHSLYNWVENMRYWKTDYDIPYPGSEGALVHTGSSFSLISPSHSTEALVYTSNFLKLPATPNLPPPVSPMELLFTQVTLAGYYPPLRGRAFPLTLNSQHLHHA